MSVLVVVVGAVHRLHNRELSVEFWRSGHGVETNDCLNVWKWLQKTVTSTSIAKSVHSVCVCACLHVCVCVCVCLHTCSPQGMETQMHPEISRSGLFWHRSQYRKELVCVWPHWGDIFVFSEIHGCVTEIWAFDSLNCVCVGEREK